MTGKGCWRDVRYWHKADNTTTPAFVHYWSNSGHCSAPWIKQYVPYTAGPMDKFLEGMRKAGLE